MPFRGAVTIVSDAPIRSARSLHAGHAEARTTSGSRAMPRPSSATDSRRPTDCAVDARIAIRRACEWRTALVSASCAMRDNLALDAVAEARKLVDDEVDRHAGRSLASDRRGA